MTTTTTTTTIHHTTAGVITVTDTTATEEFKPLIDDTMLAKMRKDDNVNLRQSDGVDTIGVYFELDLDRYSTGTVTHTLRVLFVGGIPIIQLKSSTSRSAKWKVYKDRVSSSPTPLEIEESWNTFIDSISTRYFSAGTIIKRGTPMLIQLQATDVEVIKQGKDAPMIRYTAKSVYEKNFGKGV